MVPGIIIFKFLFQGDGLTVPTKFSLIERHGEVKVSLDRKPRTDIAAFENGGELFHYWLILNISLYNQ